MMASIAMAARALIFAVAVAGNLLERPSSPFHDVSATWQESLDAALARTGPLSADDVERYFVDGFLKVEGVLDGAMLAELRGDVDAKQTEFARSLLAEGRLNGTIDAWAAIPWDEKLLRMQDAYPDASVLFAKNGKLTPAFQRLFTHDGVVAIARQLGVPADADGKLAIHPAWNLRGKMPSHDETEVPWHQDNSYWEPRLWSQQIFTAWVPLVDATPANGCMEYIRGSHLSGQTVTHTCCLGNTWYTETSLDDVAAQLGLPDAADRAVLVPARAGDMIFFGPTMVHRSIKNSGSTIRWSADLRWHQVGGPGAPPPPERAGGDELDFFYGLKNSLVIAEPGATVAPGSPAMDAWASIDRSEVQEAGLNTKAAAIDLDPIVTGPWMDIWNITRRNRHVDRYVASLPAAVRAAVDGARTDL